MSTIEIGRAGVEDGVGIEGAMAWAFSFPVLRPCLFFLFSEIDVKDASLETRTKMS